MGSTSFTPKNYNPNWSQYSRKRKLWEAEQKRKDRIKNKKQSSISSKNKTK